jgi:predicted ester cyclase
MLCLCTVIVLMPSAGVASLRGAFPDLRFTLEDEIAESNKVATRWIMRGIQGARKVDVSGMDIFVIENGRIRETWVNMETLAQAKQMGTVGGP